MFGLDLEKNIESYKIIETQYFTLKLVLSFELEYHNSFLTN
jgi:hypothetical protein